jgi:hypothetical protein
VICQSVRSMGRALAVTLVLLMMSPSTKAVSLILTDFDGSLIENKLIKEGAFQTPFLLFKHPFRKFAFDKIPETPEIVEILPHELERVQDYLRGGKFPHSIHRKFTLASGLTIVPAYYEIRHPDSFLYFMESNKESNFLVDEMKKAEIRVQTEKKTFKGLYWDMMEEVLSHPDGAKSFGMLTARAHTPEEWDRFFQHLQAAKHIQYLPELEHIHGVNHTDYDHFGPSSDTKIRKINVLKEIFKQLKQVKLFPQDEVMDPDGKSVGRYHTVVLIEDTQEILNEEVLLAIRMSQSSLYPIKFVFGNAGTETEVRESKRPRWFVITSDGGFRHATDIEIRGDLSFLREKYQPKKSSSGKAVLRCEGLFPQPTS